MCPAKRRGSSLTEHTEASQGESTRYLHAELHRATSPHSARAALQSLTPRSHSAAPALARRPSTQPRTAESSTGKASTHQRRHGTRSHTHIPQDARRSHDTLSTETTRRSHGNLVQEPPLGPDRSTGAKYTRRNQDVGEQSARTTPWQFGSDGSDAECLDGSSAAAPAAAPLHAFDGSWRVLHGGRRDHVHRRCPPRTDAVELSRTASWRALHSRPCAGGSCRLRIHMLALSSLTYLPTSHSPCHDLCSSILSRVSL